MSLNYLKMIYKKFTVFMKINNYGTSKELICKSLSISGYQIEKKILVTKFCL